MHIKRFRIGSVVSFVSRRTDEIMLRVERDFRGQVHRTGVTPLDDLLIEVHAGALDVQGLLYDSVGPVLRIAATGQEEIADCFMDLAFAGMPTKRTLIATPDTYRRVMRQSQ
jgi:hypothetical protein